MFPRIERYLKSKKLRRRKEECSSIHIIVISPCNKCIKFASELLRKNNVKKKKVKHHPQKNCKLGAKEVKEENIEFC